MILIVIRIEAHHWLFWCAYIFCSSCCCSICFCIVGGRSFFFFFFGSDKGFITQALFLNGALQRHSANIGLLVLRFIEDELFIGFVLLDGQHGCILRYNSCLIAGIFETCGMRINFYCHIIYVFCFFIFGSKYELLVMWFELYVSSDVAILTCCVISFSLFKHIFFHTLRQSHCVSATWQNKMCQVWNEKAFSGLLFGKYIRVHIAMFTKVLIKTWLSRQLPHIHLLRPKWMFTKMLPRNALDRIFLKKSAQKIREKSWRACYWLVRLRLNFSNQLLQSTCFEWWQTCCHLVQNAAERPHVRLITVHSLIIEKFRSHVVRRAIFSFRSILFSAFRRVVLGTLFA